MVRDIHGEEECARTASRIQYGYGWSGFTVAGHRFIEVEQEIESSQFSIISRKLTDIQIIGNEVIDTDDFSTLDFSLYFQSAGGAR